MKALTWHGKNDIRCDTVPDPKIEHGVTPSSKSPPAPSAVRTCISSTASCPTMEKGDILGHETMGEVVEVGSDNKELKVGDRVVVPFTISCGECFFCKKGFFSGCERSNPNTRWPRSFGATRRRACSAIRICWAGTLAGRRSISAFPMLTSARSRCRQD